MVEKFDKDRYIQRKYVPIHMVVHHSGIKRNQPQRLAEFYALTRCDSISFLAGHSKKPCWGVYSNGVLH